MYDWHGSASKQKRFEHKSINNCLFIVLDVMKNHARGFGNLYKVQVIIFW